MRVYVWFKSFSKWAVLIPVAFNADELFWPHPFPEEGGAFYVSAMVT